MKSSLLSFFSLLFATAILTSCEKCGNVTITEPTAAEAAWLVYKANDSIRFVTATGDNVVYARTGIFAQDVPGEGFTATDECIESIDTQIRTVLEDVKKNQPSLSTRIFTKPGDLQVSVGVADQGLWEIQEEEPGYETLEVNGKVYNEVHEVVTDNTSAGSVKRILFNKEFGFLSLEFNSGKVLRRRP